METSGFSGTLPLVPRMRDACCRDRGEDDPHTWG